MHPIECRGSKLIALSVAGLLLTTSAWAEAGAKAYTISREPTQEVLVVKVSIPQTGLIRSMTLYGDYRLVLRRHGPGQQIFESHVLKLESNEVEALLRIVVDHDLPDYDETDIMARQIRADAEDGLGHIGVDGAVVFVNIALESYTSHARTRNTLVQNKNQ